MGRASGHGVAKTGENKVDGQEFLGSISPSIPLLLTIHLLKRRKMKAIIIEEERFTEICELMRFECEKLGHDSSTPERLNWSRNIWREAVMEAHRSMNYHFIVWAQSHGASCIR